MTAEAPPLVFYDRPDLSRPAVSYSAQRIYEITRYGSLSRPKPVVNMSFDEEMAQQFAQEDPPPTPYVTPTLSPTPIYDSTAQTGPTSTPDKSCSPNADSFEGSMEIVDDEEDLLIPINLTRVLPNGTFSNQCGLRVEVEVGEDWYVDFAAVCDLLTAAGNDPRSCSTEGDLFFRYSVVKAGEEPIYHFDRSNLSFRGMNEVFDWITSVVKRRTFDAPTELAIPTVSPLADLDNPVPFATNAGRAVRSNPQNGWLPTVSGLLGLATALGGYFMVNGIRNLRNEWKRKDRSVGRVAGDEVAKKGQWKAKWPSGMRNKINEKLGDFFFGFAVRMQKPIQTEGEKQAIKVREGELKQTNKELKVAEKQRKVLARKLARLEKKEKKQLERNMKRALKKIDGKRTILQSLQDDWEIQSTPIGQLRPELLPIALIRAQMEARRLKSNLGQPQKSQESNFS